MMPGDYYVSVTDYYVSYPTKAYIQQLTPGVVVGNLYRIDLTYDISAGVYVNFGGNERYIRNTGSKQSLSYYVTATTTDGFKLYPNEDDNAVKYYKADAYLINEVELGNVDMKNGVF